MILYCASNRKHQGRPRCARGGKTGRSRCRISGNERRRVVAARATMPAASRYLPIECHEPLARCKHKGVGSWRAHACGGAATRHPHVCHKTSARTGCWKPGHVGRNMIPARRPFFAKIGPPRRNHISALAKLRPEFGRNLVGRHSLIEFRPPPSQHICGGMSPWGGTGMSRRPKSVPPGPKTFPKAPLRGAS